MGVAFLFLLPDLHDDWFHSLRTEITPVMDKLLTSHEVEYIRNKGESDAPDLDRIMKDVEGYIVEISDGQVRTPFESEKDQTYLIEPDDIQSYSLELPDEVGAEGHSVIWQFNP